MIRLIAFAFMFPFVIVLVWDDAPTWAIWAGWAIGAGVLLLMFLQGNLVLTCPNCGKRVKLGYTTCHHCGAQVGRPNRLAKAQPRDPSAYVKQCSHCMSHIHPEADVCPQCRRDVQKWTLHEQRWWTRAVDTGEWLWLDDDSQWRIVEPGQAVPSEPVTATTS